MEIEVVDNKVGLHYRNSLRSINNTSELLKYFNNARILLKEYLKKANIEFSDILDSIDYFEYHPNLCNYDTKTKIKHRLEKLICYIEYQIDHLFLWQELTPINWYDETTLITKYLKKFEKTYMEVKNKYCNYYQS